MNFLDDEEKMKDFLNMGKDQFLDSYSYLTEDEYNATVKALWNDFGEVPIDNHDLIQTDWYIFKKGTDRFEIWSWFEDHFQVSVALDLLELPENEV